MQDTKNFQVLLLLNFLHNRLAVFHEYTSTRASDGSPPINVGAPLHLLGHTSASRVVGCTVLVRCISSLEILLASRGRPPGFNPLQRGCVYYLAPEAPLFEGIPTGPEAFWGLPDGCGLQSFDRNKLKTTLRHTHTFGGAYVKYQCTNQRDIITCDTICVVDG